MTSTAELTVKDRSGRELGSIREIGFGKFEAYNQQETRLGSYNATTDKTYDRLGLEIGSGNQLPWLIRQSWQH